MATSLLYLLKKIKRKLLTDDPKPQGRALRATNSDTDPVLYSYQSAIANLMRNQQMALAACLAASAVAHLPIQNELPPVQAPQLPRPKLVAIRTAPKNGAKTAAAKSAKSAPVKSAPVKAKRLQPVTVNANRLRSKTPAARQASIINARQRLRFILERESLKRINSIGEGRPFTPTAVEMQLPWKRDDDDDGSFPVKQSEFPLWVENKEYTSYYSPTNTFLGDLDKSRNAHPSVIGLFNRESMTQIPIPADLEPAVGASASPSYVVTVSIPEESAHEDDSDNAKTGHSH